MKQIALIPLLSILLSCNSFKRNNPSLERDGYRIYFPPQWEAVEHPRYRSILQLQPKAAKDSGIPPTITVTSRSLAGLDMRFNKLIDLLIDEMREDMQDFKLMERKYGSRYVSVVIRETKWGVRQEQSLFYWLSQGRVYLMAYSTNLLKNDPHKEDVIRIADNFEVL